MLVQAAKIIGTGLATTGLTGAGVGIGIVFGVYYPKMTKSFSTSSPLFMDVDVTESGSQSSQDEQNSDIDMGSGSESSQDEQNRDIVIESGSQSQDEQNSDIEDSEKRYKQAMLQTKTDLQCQDQIQRMCDPEYVQKTKIHSEDINTFFNTILNGTQKEIEKAMNPETFKTFEDKLDTFNSHDASSWSNLEVEQYFRRNNLSSEELDSAFKTVEKELIKTADNYLNEPKPENSEPSEKEELNNITLEDALVHLKECKNMVYESLHDDSTFNPSLGWGQSENTDPNNNRQSPIDYVAELEACEPMDIIDPYS